MLKLCLSALALGVLSAIVLPVVTFVASLYLFHALVPQCGTPGDSGGCEMSAAMIGLGSALPGFLIGVAVGLRRGLKCRRAQSGDQGEIGVAPPELALPPTANAARQAPP